MSEFFIERQFSVSKHRIFEIRFQSGYKVVVLCQPYYSGHLQYNGCLIK